MTTSDITSFARRWYQNVEIPEITTARYGEFAAKSVSFTNTLSGQIPIIQISYDKPEAYVVHPNKQSPAIISIPAWYFDTTFYEKLGYSVEETPFAAVSMLNGTLNHESLHLKLSLPDLEQIYQVRTDKTVEVQEQLRPILYRILNLVEDIFIESSFKSDGAMEYNFVDAKNQIIFQQSDFELSKVHPDIQTLLGHLGFWKNEHLRTEDWSDVRQEIVEELRHAQSPLLTQSERADIGMKIYSIMTDHSSKDELKQAAQQMTGKDQWYGEKKGTWKAQASFSPDGEKTDEDGGDYAQSGREKSSVQKAIEKAIQAVSTKKTTVKVDENGEPWEAFALSSNVEVTEYYNSNQPVTEEDVMNLPYPYRVISPESSYYSLGTVLSQIRTIGQKPTSVVGQERGTRLIRTKLYRIGMDGKVFGSHDAMTIAKAKDKEIILLLDFSGSTASTYVDSRHETLLEMIARVGWAGFESLRRARIPVRVYAHTSNSSGPWVLHIASEGPHFKDDKSLCGDSEQRFPRCLSSLNGINYDGVALRYVSKKFSSKNSKKIIIIISDGQPSGAPSGFEAVSHTAQTAKDLQRAGITTISLSLTEEAMQANTKIYGKNNIDATDPLKFVNEFRQLVQQLVEN